MQLPPPHKLVIVQIDTEISIPEFYALELILKSNYRYL